MLRPSVGILCALVGSFGANPVPALAQHHHDGGVVRHHQDNVLYDRHGHRVVDHHDDYHYVVPAHDNHGTFYTYEDARYYTPPSVSGRQAVYRPAVVEFGGFAHVEELSTRLARSANQFCLDLYYNYRHNPGFKETYREAYQILAKAKYVHDSGHGGEQETIRQTLSDMDNGFHHVVEDIQGWSRHVHRPVGHGGIGPKVTETEALIHHLMYDVGVKPDHDAGSDEQAEGEAIAPSKAAVAAPELEPGSDVAPQLP